MIRKLIETDRTILLNFLYQDVEYNIFPIGDVEAFGFDTSFQRLYGEFDKQGHLLSMLLHYHKNAIYYASMPRFNHAYLNIFLTDPFTYISGKSELLDLIALHLPNFHHKRMFLCKADVYHQDILPTSTEIKQVTTIEECQRLYDDLLVTIPEFGYHKTTRATFVTEKMHGLKMGVTLYLEAAGKIVASAATTAETTKNAMVVAVATHHDHRHCGHATALIKRLLEIYLVTKNKSLCLFYDNPEAGHIYHRAGFTHLGTWDMYERMLEKE